MKETNRNRANVAKRRARQRKLRNRRIALTVCLMLVVMVASIGGTVAWLTATTAPVENTFTYGDINITLTETKGTLNSETKEREFKIIPGVNIEKDPKVTVKGGSEACWLFVEVKEEGTFVANKVTYSVADGWTKGDGTKIPANVYYREVGAVATDTDFNVLKDNKVYVSTELTKSELKDITAANQPKLTFTAYAVQLEGFANNPVGAWTQAQNAANS